MAYALIAKLKKFTSEKDNAQVWLNNMKKAIVANSWNDARVMQAIPYFLQDTANSWNLHQIQAIQADYFTAPQILNQFIRDLCSSILQCICPMHSADLQATVTNA
ncbi:hypothetical protein G9A89_022358 [Geosiphon pyriformis]|nr:hypothetical protein G9A89_022358 [Geosiphon pyriformis]